MRVLEVKPGSSSNIMPKRKHKIQKDKKGKHVQEIGDSDSSDEANSLPQHGGCPHVAKAVNTNAVKKSLKQQGIVGECRSCTDNQGAKSQNSRESSSVDPSPEYLLEELETTIWVCLQCGFQGCDRNSKNQHALNHFQTPRSHSHALVVNLTTWAVWCYECDNDVDTPSKKLEQCIEVVRKFAGMPKADAHPLQGKKSGSLKSDSQSLDLNSESASNNIKEDKQMQRKSSGHIPTIAKVKGLSNLGNTCFFNAVMQNLTQTSLLEKVMVEHCRKGYLQHLRGGLMATEMDDDEEDEEESEDGESESSHHLKFDPIDITLGECGTLTTSVKSFFGDMNAQTKHSTVSPGALFGQVCRKAPRFKGFQQQDSHELLRHLLDGMKAEEVKRAQQAILKAFHLPDSINPKKVDEEKRARVKEYGRQVKHTFVDQVFGGHFISTVFCEECGDLSQIFEPFLDISLPITEEKTPRPNFNHSNKKKEPHGASNTSENASTKPKANVSKKVQRREKKKAKREQKFKNKIGKAKASEEVEEKKEKLDNEEGESKENKDQEESQSGNEEDNSDADIEDNIEGLTDSNKNRFQVLVGGEEDNSEKLTEINGDIIEETTSKSHDQLSNTDNKEKLLDNNTNLNNTAQLTPEEGVNETENGNIDNKLDNCCKEETINHIDTVTNEVEQLTLEDKLNDNANGNTMCLCKEEEGVYEAKSLEKIVHPRVQGQKGDFKREAKRKAMDTLARKHQPHAQECSITSCLNQFTAQELLTGTNKFGCDECTRQRYGRSHGDGVKTVYSNASKQVLIFCPPAILTLHLKRFQQVGFSFRKVNRHVEFPLLLDLAPYCSTLALGVEPSQTQVLYSLYGVVEHSGRLSGGHYTAYVKARGPNEQSRAFLHQYDIGNIKLHKQLEEKLKCRFTEQSQDGAGVDAMEPQPGKWYHISDSRVDEVTESSVLRCQAYLLFYERIM